MNSTKTGGNSVLILVSTVYKWCLGWKKRNQMLDIKKLWELWEILQKEYRNWIFSSGERLHQCRAAGSAVLGWGPEHADGRVSGAGAAQGRGVADPPRAEGGTSHHRRHLHQHHHHPSASSCGQLLASGWSWGLPQVTSLLHHIVPRFLPKLGVLWG